MSSNYENSYAIVNGCVPCNLFNEPPIINSPRGSHFSQGSRFMSSSRRRDDLPLVSSARVSQTHYVDPYAARRSRILSAVDHSHKQDQIVNQIENQHLAGYTGGTRISFN